MRSAKMQHDCSLKFTPPPYAIIFKAKSRVGGEEKEMGTDKIEKLSCERSLRVQLELIMQMQMPLHSLLLLLMRIAVQQAWTLPP